jgi:hypothetical protein
MQQTVDGVRLTVGRRCLMFVPWTCTYTDTSLKKLGRLLDVRYLKWGVYISR